MIAEHRAWVALGANLGPIRSNLRGALAALDSLPGTRVRAASRWYRSRAIGPPGQPDYINGVAELRTTLTPHALLAALQRIERAAGRERSERWGARTLDLDLLLFDMLRIADRDLVIPHARLAERNFVVFPLHDVAPQLHLPDGTSVASLREQLGSAGLLATFADLEQLDD